MQESLINFELGAIVCGHIAREGLPILRAVRAEKQDAGDSGWQFLCYSGKAESIADAQIWSIRQVIEKEPSLKSFIDAPTGTKLVRATKSSTWEAQV